MSVLFYLNVYVIKFSVVSNCYCFLVWRVVSFLIYVFFR